MAKALPANETEARELALYATNDADLYRQRAIPMIANLRKKKAKGIYNAELAVKLFVYMADDAAKKYSKEFGPCSFSVATRKLAAEQILSHYEEAINE